MKMSGMTGRGRRALMALAVVASAGMVLAGCSSASDDAAAPADGGDVVLYEGVRSLSNSYHANWVDGGNLFGDSVGLEVNVITDEGDSQRQLSQVRALGAAGKVYALNVDPNTSSDTEAIVRAVADAGGFVVTQWSKPDDLNPWDIGDNWVAHISFDGRVSGEEVATTLFDKMGGSGNIIAIQGILDNVAAQQRFEGLQNALAAAPGITLLEDQAANFDRSQGLAVAQTLIAKYGDQIDGIWAANDEMALGALEALRAAGLQGKIPIVGFDAVPEALEAIKDASTGYLATVSTDPWWQGGAGLSLAYKAATGKIKVGELSHEQRAFYGTQTIVTSDNVGDFTKAPELSVIQPDFDDPWLRSQGAIK
jgi:ribose transport system substrate-binding protein